MRNRDIFFLLILATLALSMYINNTRKYPYEQFDMGFVEGYEAGLKISIDNRLR